MIKDASGKNCPKHLLKKAKKNSVDIGYYLCGKHLCWLTQIRDSDYHSKCLMCK